MYADDIVIASSNQNTMQRALDSLKTFADNSRFVFNVKKCETISRHQFRIGNDYMPTTEKFKYLGIILDDKGIRWKDHFEERGKSALARMFWFQDLGLHGNGFNFETNARLSKTFIQPIADYGIQLCNQVTKRKELERVMGVVLRNIFSFSRSVSLDAMYTLCHIDSPSQRFEKLSFQFIQRTSALNESEFAVKRALLSHLDRPLSKSCFHSFKGNWFYIELLKMRH